MDESIIQGWLNLINEANSAIPTDGEFAQDVVAVCQHWFTEQNISIQLNGDSYALQKQEGKP